MKKKITILLVLLFCLSACSKNEEVKMKDIFGIYEYTYHDDDPKWNLVKHIIEINPDTTYIHKIYQGNTLIIEEEGQYEFNRFVPSVDFFEFTTYRKYVEEIPTRKKSSMFTIKRSLFGSLSLACNWPFDPDGAPIRPKYKKIK
jgi:hypothetical protein